LKKGTILKDIKERQRILEGERFSPYAALSVQAKRKIQEQEVEDGHRENFPLIQIGFSILYPIPDT